MNTRYTSEAQIFEQIDAMKKQVVALREKANEMDATTDKLVRDPDANRLQRERFAQEIQERRDAANKLRLEASRIEEQKLPEVGEALSAFRTEQLSPCKDDGSVPAVPWRKVRV